MGNAIMEKRAPTSTAVKMRTDMYERPRDVSIRPVRRYRAREEKRSAILPQKKRKKNVKISLSPSLLLSLYLFLSSLFSIFLRFLYSFFFN